MNELRLFFRLRFILALMACFAICCSIAFGQAEGKHEEKEEGAIRRFGDHMAVTVFSKEDGFKLSERGMKSLGVEFKPLSQASPWMVPKSALVRIKHATGVYRRVDGWISLVLVKAAPNGGGETVSIISTDLQAGDEVAISGTQFLRMTELDLTSDTVDTCSH